MVPDPVLLGQPCQVYGGLEAFAGGQGIANQTQALLRQEPETKSAMLEAVRGDIEAIKAEHVFEAARHQDKAARRVLDKALDYLAVSVANIVSLLDPDLIIIGGGVARSGDFLIEAIKPRFEGMLLQYPPLVLSTLGDEAVLYGALSLGQSYLQKQR
jgi:glucokinase